VLACNPIGEKSKGDPRQHKSGSPPTPSGLPTTPRTDVNAGGILNVIDLVAVARNMRSNGHGGGNGNGQGHGNVARLDDDDEDEDDDARQNRGNGRGAGLDNAINDIAEDVARGRGRGRS
jgi:hypothetical protein